MPTPSPSKWLRERFPIGCRVELTDDGMRSGFYGNDRVNGRLGTVIGYGCKIDHTKPDEHIRVRRDSVRTAKRYHEKFWEPIEVIGVVA